MPIANLSRILVFVAFLLSGAGRALAAAEAEMPGVERGRLAIVLGNSNYQSERFEDLANAVNDAGKLTERLKRLNFEVVTGLDVTAQDFERILAETELRLEGYDAVVVFFAGHGIQIKGENYLLPADTPDPDSLEKLTSSAIKLNNVITRLANRNRQTFIFLDACRNNPLGPGSSDGLAQVEVGENTFIAFATQPGNVTVDGTGDNSPFTTALLKNIEIPGLSVSDMMIRVRNETEALTVGRQVPWDQSNLREQFYFTEQQVLDASTLSASLSQILSDPGMKEKLLVQLASNDLQTAVLTLGEQLRSVELGEKGVDQPAAKLASLSPALTVEDARESVVSGLETLIVSSISAKEEDGPRIDLARSVQTELARLGCYRMTVDGDWGKGSIRALQDYFKFTRQAEAKLQPNAELLGELFLRSGRVCKAPVKVKPAVTAQTRQNRPVAERKTSGKRSSGSSPQRPAPPPPDINAGIGIGGVF